MSMFEIKCDGKIVCHGDYPECFPSTETAKTMKSSGLKIYVDGKLYTKGATWNNCNTAT